MRACSCGSAADYQNCTKIWGDRPLSSHCSRDQMYTLIEYQGSFMRKISTKPTFSKPQNGAFLYQCFTHVAGNCECLHPPARALARIRLCRR